jgi:predicted MPP superfamily phosphohydrolase
MILRMIFFLGTFLSILVCAHLLVHLSVIKLFGIVNPNVKRTLLGLFLFLAASFPASFFLFRFQRSVFTQVYYMLSACWIGFLANALIAVVIVWLVIGVSRLAGYTLPLNLLGMLCVVAALAASGYGMWNAYHPRLKHVAIALENLPEQWKDKTIVQISDVHLGTFHRAGFLRRIGRQISSVSPELVLITGDLFDGMGDNLSSFAEAFDSLSASKGVFFVTGNHEEYLGLTKPLAILEKTSITVLDNQVIDIEGLQLVGISFPAFERSSNAKNPIQLKGKLDPGKPSILMYHTPTDIGHTKGSPRERHYETYWTPNTTFAFAKENGIDLQLSGHTHKGQLFPFGLITRLTYKGYDYGLHREGAFALYTSSGVGTWGPPMRTGSTPEIVVITLQ